MAIAIVIKLISRPNAQSMIEAIESILKQATGASEVWQMEILQSLWSGYGSIVRYELVDAAHPTVVVKHVSPPTTETHPRGWNTDRSHQRKLRSYAVETNWYQNYAVRCGVGCRVPQCLAVEREGDQVLLVLEDLDAAGYPLRLTSVSDAELTACLSWLAEFHAAFLDDHGVGLWESGTYWHLDTRPDELEVLRKEDPELHAVAQGLDARLKASPFQTLVHGDVKLANFCFSEDGDAVAAVDFQYVGRGCGMKDLVYFIGSCFDEDACAKMETEILDLYFSKLKTALTAQEKTV
ncbi:MAG: phosphotransferase, partial [Verrucomicrobiota bacterium]